MFPAGTLSERLDVAEAAVNELCSVLDPGSIPLPDIHRVYATVTRLTHQLAGAGTLLARRVEESSCWRLAGDLSAEHFLARTSGTTTSEARAQLAASQRLAELPNVEAAVRAGELSVDQTCAVVDGAAADPDSEHALLTKARRGPLSELRDEARRVKAAADTDPDTTRARIHNGRHLRRFTDAEGAYNLQLRTTAESGAAIDAALKPAIERVFDQARTQGRREPLEAYAADALHVLVTGAAAGVTDARRSGRARETKVIALVSHDALVRGNTEHGEVCELAGVGPVAVSTVRSMMADAFLAAVVTDGVDVYRVAHLGRQVTAHQRTALEARGYRCEVPGCGGRHNLEIDHTLDWAVTRTTSLDALAWLCGLHHDDKTYRGFRLTGPPGDRAWLAPDDPGPDPHTHSPPVRPRSLFDGAATVSAN